MAGRIRDDDVALVRERARIDDVVREYVSLKPAGGGSLKGLCPFHDERSPSFHVTPSRGMFYCFGCGEGGDVLTFVQKADHLSFAEAVEKLAGKAGVQLRYVEGTVVANRQQGQRTRLVEANRAAADFFGQRLADAEADTGRRFLAERGFDDAAVARFAVGFAPRSWDALARHLRGKGFSDSEILTAGLAAQGSRGIYDRFRGRLVWPIRDPGGDVVGFGARRLFDDDEGPKYLNTPETPLYKKGQVLYGIDLARRAIAKSQSAVIVEGYTDVMACHLAGIETAVATCGTAFGAEHIRVLRRLLMDDDRMRGEIVFTFDGDEAGRRAALRAFGEDQRFMAQTWVAVEPGGLDPCDLRQQRGDEAVRELVARRAPLFEFAIRSALASYNLETPEGRVAGLREAAPIVAAIRDPALRPEYSRSLAGWLGMDVESVGRAVAAALRSGSRPVGQQVQGHRGQQSPQGQDQRGEGQQGQSQPSAAPADPATAAVEREALKCALQEPALAAAAGYGRVDSSAFVVPAHALVHAAMATAGGARADVSGIAWADAVLAACPDDSVRTSVRALSVEPIPAVSGVDARYAESVVARLLELATNRRIADLRGRLQRVDPASEESQQVFAELVGLEGERRALRERGQGEG